MWIKCVITKFTGHIQLRYGLNKFSSWTLLKLEKNMYSMCYHWPSIAHKSHCDINTGWSFPVKPRVVGLFGWAGEGSLKWSIYLRFDTEPQFPLHIVWKYLNVIKKAIYKLSVTIVFWFSLLKEPLFFRETFLSICHCQTEIVLMAVKGFCKKQWNDYRLR